MKKLISFILCVLVIGQLKSQTSMPERPDFNSFVLLKNHFRSHVMDGQRSVGNQSHGLFSPVSNPYWLDSIVDIQSQDNLMSNKYQYDENNMLESEHINMIYGILQIPYLWSEYTYESDTLVTKRLIQGIDFETMQWMVAGKTDYSYDSENRLSFEMNSVWIDSLEIWIPSEQLVFDYDDFGNRLRTTLMEWDTTDLSWHNQTMGSVTYDTAQNLIEYLEQHWNEEAGLWANWNKEVSSYNAEGQKTQFVDYHYSSAMWNPGNKYVYNYNAQQLMYQEDVYGWDENTHQWYLSWQRIYEYDEFGNSTKSTEFRWNDDTGLWENEFQYLSEYNAMYTYQNLILPWESQLFSYVYSNPIYPSPYNNFDNIQHMFSAMLLSTINQRWNEDISEWETWAEKEFYYSDHLTNTEETSIENLIRVFPNPAVNEVIVESGQTNTTIHFELYNLLGKKILNYQGPGKHIDISTIPAGAYLYRINGSTEVSGKLLIVK